MGEADEDDSLAVWRPAGQDRLERRVDELDAVASVAVGAPQAAVGVGDVDDVGSIFGEGEKIGGDSRKERLELFGLRIEAVELAAAGEAGGEELLSILAGNGSGPGERT